MIVKYVVQPDELEMITASRLMDDLEDRGFDLHRPVWMRIGNEDEAGIFTQQTVERRRRRRK